MPSSWPASTPADKAWAAEHSQIWRFCSGVSASSDWPAEVMHDAIN